MPTFVLARDGDTLCGLAMEAGFLNCDPVRNEPANQGQDFLNRPTLKDGDFVVVPDKEVKEESKGTDTLHQFVKKTSPPVRIRFVHGSPNKPYLQDDELLYLNVSQFQTDKGGAKADKNFPTDADFGFRQAGHADRDSFKVEVVDPAAGGPVKVKLEALKPVYKPDGTIEHVEFTGAELAKRTLEVQCKKVSSGVAFRSSYLRLVSDEADHDGTVGPVAPNGFAPPAGNPRVKQTLLVTDMVDQGEPDIEILDQKVRASYELVDRCSRGPKCVATKTVPVSSDADPRKPRRRLKVTVQVLNNAVGGAGVVTAPNAERRIRKWMRRVLAQLSLSPKLVEAVRLVDPPENMVVVSDPDGAFAVGNGQLGFRINAAGQPSQVVGPINPAAFDTPLTSAAALAALVQPPYNAQVTSNPPRFPDPIGHAAADILITEAGGAHVTIDQLVSTDSGQTLKVARANPLNLQSWDGDNFLVGSMEQRVILKNYDTGDDRIDIFVVQQVTLGDRGEAMMSGHSLDPLRTATTGVKFSVFMIQSAMDGTDNDPLPLTHEAGHVAGDVGHADSNTNELMCDRVSGNNAPGSSKRIRDGLIKYDMLVTNPRHKNFNLTDRWHQEGAAAGLLDPW